MADRMTFSEDPFGAARRRRRPPATSHPARTNWREKWAQMNHNPQPILSQDPPRRRSQRPTQPTISQGRYPSQIQSRPTSMEVVDLTEDGDDESSEATPPYEDYQNIYQRPARFNSRSPYRGQDSGPLPRYNDDFQGLSNSSRNRNYASRLHQQGWDDQEPQSNNHGYKQAWQESQDWKGTINQYDQAPHHQEEFSERQPRHQRSYESRHQQQSMSHGGGYHENFLAEPSEEDADGGGFEPPSFQRQVRNLTTDALPRQANHSSHPANQKDRNVKQWLKTSVPPPSAPYHFNNQHRFSQFNARHQENEFEVQVPDSQRSSTLGDRADGHDRLLENSEGNNSYSTLNTSIHVSPPILDQRAHQLKVSQQERFARIRFMNSQSSKLRSQPPPSQAAAPRLHPQHELLPASSSMARPRNERQDNPSAGGPAKKQKVSHPVETESSFDPFEPPPSMQKTVRFQDQRFEQGTISGAVMNLTTDSGHANAGFQSTNSHSMIPDRNTLQIPSEVSCLTQEELQRAYKVDEEQIAAKLARDREKLLEQDEDLQRARREERQARLRIELDEAKAARMEEHIMTMASIKEKQRAIDEKAAQHKAEEEKRKYAKAEKERLAKKERDAANREAALQRTIQARKEAELIKAQKAAAISAFRQELKAPLPSQQQPENGTTLKSPTPLLGGKLQAQLSSSDRPAVIARTAPKTPSDRRREVEVAKSRAEAQELLGLRQKDLANLSKREKELKKAETQRQKEEKRKQKEEEKKFKELRREAKRMEKEAAKEENRPRKRPVKLPKPGTVVQTTTQQPNEAPKTTFGGFLEDDSESSAASPSDSESDEDALFCSAPKETTSVSVDKPRRHVACVEHHLARRKCPVDCHNWKPRLTSTPSTDTPEPQSALTAPFGGFASSPSKTSNPISHTPKPKHTELHSSRAISQTPHVTNRRTTGGKTLNAEAIAACLESLEELRGREDEEEADVDSEIEELIQQRQRRQHSPISDRDKYRYSYRVERKTWRPNFLEEASEWIVCGKPDYSSLQQANAMADKESTRQRHGYSLQPYVKEWNRKEGPHGMVEIYIDCCNKPKDPGFVKIRVVRQLRTVSNGVRPETKFGWLKTTVWEICKTTTTTVVISPSPRKKVDPLFEEEEPEAEPETETYEEVEMLDDGIFTNVDEANRKAANLALDIVATQPQTRNMDELLAYQKKRQEESEGIFALCDELEQDGEDGTFEAEFQVEGGPDIMTVKIEVVGRELKGPRNI